MSNMEELRKECAATEADFAVMEETYENYSQRRIEMQQHTSEFQKSIKHEKYLMGLLAETFRKTESQSLTEDEKSEVAKLRTKVSDMRARLQQLQAELPVPDNGFYLSLILGSNLNISLPTAAEKFKYKQDYENFKYKVTMLIIGLTIFSSFASWRVVDSINNFVMVWYYCTLTIRESILRVNGSKIKGWWLIHHYLSCAFCGVHLTWREGDCYQSFRQQFLYFIFYVGVVQIMQHKYQSGCLRRLHALGQGHEMDITLEGFTGWMFKGLTFLLPFLFLGYVSALSLLFLGIAIGNITTTCLVILRKIRRSQADVARFLRVRTKTD